MRINAIVARSASMCVPYEALAIERINGDGAENGNGKQRLIVRAAKCKGCGTCQATCPKEGISVTGFTYGQLSAQVRAALGVQ